MENVPDYRRFTVQVKPNSEERAALKRLAESERLPVAQVLRRLVWREAQKLPQLQGEARK